MFSLVRATELFTALWLHNFQIIKSCTCIAFVVWCLLGTVTWLSHNISVIHTGVVEGTYLLHEIACFEEELLIMMCGYESLQDLDLLVTFPN